MKSAKKKPSLLHAHQENNLKHMLDYYDDKITQPIPSFQPIYQYEEIITEEVMLPKTSSDNFLFPSHRNCSSEFQRSNNHHNQDNLINLNKQLSFKSKNTSRQLFSRESQTSMNKKLKNIRTSHIRSHSRRVNELIQQNQQKVQAEQGVLTTREAPIAVNGFISRKTIFSPYGQRAVNIMMEDSTNISERKVATSHERRRSLKQDENGSAVINRYNLLRRNPHVIYQFETHLKAKRVDDNPKVLGNIIRKKCNQLGKEELYGYIEGLIKRRKH